MEGHHTANFDRDFRGLPKEIQDQFKRKIGLFLLFPFHPSFHTKRMAGHSEIWEARLTHGYRWTFEWHGTVCIFRRIGTHDILRRP